MNIIKLFMPIIIELVIVIIGYGAIVSFVEMPTYARIILVITIPISLVLGALFVFNRSLNKGD